MECNCYINQSDWESWNEEVIFQRFTVFQVKNLLQNLTKLQGQTEQLSFFDIWNKNHNAYPLFAQNIYRI